MIQLRTTLAGWCGNGKMMVNSSRKMGPEWPVSFVEKFMLVLISVCISLCTMWQYLKIFNWKMCFLVGLHVKHGLKISWYCWNSLYIYHALPTGPFASCCLQCSHVQRIFKISKYFVAEGNFDIVYRLYEDGSGDSSDGNARPFILSRLQWLYASLPFVWL